MAASPLRIAGLAIACLVAGAALATAPARGQASFADDPTLHELAARGDPARIARAIHQGVPVDVRDAAGRTPLHVAAKEAHLFAVMMLLAKGAQIDPRDREKRTPLHLAAGGDPSADGERFQIVKVLVGKGADPKAVDAYGKRPVDYATRAEIRRLLTP